jgi:hypothetical protein
VRRPPPSRTGQAATEGGLIAVTEEGVIGWARNPSRPGDLVEVELLIDGHPISRARADRFGEPLVVARFGEGVPAFRVDLDALPDRGFPLTLTLRAKGGGDLGPPLQVSRRPAAIADTAAPRGYDGRIEGLENGTLRGWAADLSIPDRSVIVELLDGDRPIARMVAAEWREQVTVSGRRGGRWGFAFPLPATLIDGTAHNLRVVIPDADYELRDGPVAIGATANTELADELARLRVAVEDLRGLVAALTAPGSALQQKIMATLAERFAAFSEIQRELIEAELDAFRALAIAPDRTMPAKPTPVPAPAAAKPRLPRS